MTSLPFDALLCDLDGVLRRWDPRLMPGLDHKYGLAPGTLARTAFAPEHLNDAITGVHTDEQWRTAVAASLAGACGALQVARELRDALAPVLSAPFRASGPDRWIR